MEVLNDEYEKIARFLKTEYEWGKNWVVYEEGSLIRSPSELHTFSEEQHARQYAHDNTSHFDFMTAETIKNSLFTIKTKHMNAQNLEFLGSNLKYLGFGDKLNGDLEKNLKEQKAEFQMKAEIPHFNSKMDYTLHFKKSDNSDMYFFNRYDAKLQNGKPEEEKNQSFYLNKGSGVTAKEAFNLMEGRSVLKDLVNKDGQKYSAWVKLDFDNKDDKGNAKLKQFSEQYGYNLEKTLSSFPIKEMQDPDQKKNLLNSLGKGNAQQVTMSKDGKEAKYFIEAVPQFKNINVYDQKMHPVRRQNVQESFTAKTESLSEAQKPSKKQDQKNESEDEKSKPKQTRKRKLTV